MRGLVVVIRGLVIHTDINLRGLVDGSHQSCEEASHADANLRSFTANLLGVFFCKLVRSETAQIVISYCRVDFAHGCSSDISKAEP